VGSFIVLWDPGAQHSRARGTDKDGRTRAAPGGNGMDERKEKEEWLEVIYSRRPNHIFYHACIREGRSTNPST